MVLLTPYENDMPFITVLMLSMEYMIIETAALRFDHGEMGDDRMMTSVISLLSHHVNVPRGPLFFWSAYVT